MDSISLYDLQHRIKNALEEAYLSGCWVVAEISELKVNNSGHCYLELVEKGGNNQVPRAKANAVIWRTTFGFLADYFLKQTGGRLAPGMKVLLKVEVNYHELYGLSLVVKDIDPSYTLGDMERQRQETILRLQNEGIFEMNREIELPVVIQRIAVVSSDKAAGYQDFMNELLGNEYGYHIATTLFNAVMQGVDSESTIISAMDAIAYRSDEFDAVVLIRGGGSQSDLGCFDSYRLCNHIAQFPIAVITGIGHDKDVSVADLVAAVSVKTPTAVARYLIDAMLQFESRLNATGEHLIKLVAQKSANEQSRLLNLGLTLKNSVQSSIHQADKALESMQGVIGSRAQSAITLNRNTLQHNLSSLLQRAQQQLEESHNQLQNLKKELTTLARQRLSSQGRTLELFLAKIEGKNPEHILKMGYSIVRTHGRPLRSIHDVPIGASLEIEVSDGTITTEVKNKKTR